VAIVVVHYAGVACEMDAIGAIAARHGLLLIEDDAQGMGSSYKGRPLGSFGDLAAVSFHETKNVIAGEGGALLINSERFVERAEIIREKGTNRSQFFRGQVDKYSWVDLGSSFLPSDILAAFLLAQLEDAKSITQRRVEIWDRYHAAFEGSERQGAIRRPVVPEHCIHNAHMYYLLLPGPRERTAFIDHLGDAGIQAVFHYIPLHSSGMGKKVGRPAGRLAITDNVSDRLVRLPLWLGLETHLDAVIDRSLTAIGE
jgi:dTDP-4-amino-4,6-dideoxygalactose transaminase